MKRSSKFLSLLLSLAMIVSLFVPAMAAEITPYSVPSDVSGKLVIIHTNDTHGRDVAAEAKTIGTAGVVALKKEFEAAGAEVLLLSAGDFSQGTTLVGLDQGASAVDFMNAAGYDVATLGNHEFDFKMDALRANVAKAEFPILGSNVVDAATKKPLFGDRVTFDTPAGKVGIFGVVTPETMTKAHPDNVKGLTMYQGEAMYADAQAQVNALKADGCKYIIALGHLGVSEESIPNRSTDLLAKVTGIDLFIDGHSHTEIPGGQKVGGTLLVSTGEYLNNVGVVIVDGANTTARLISAAEYAKVDAEVAAVINARADAVKEEMSKTFGATEVLLNGARDPGNRTEETNLGNFAADAILWSARGNVGEDKVDAALTNGGGIRDSIKVGPITMNDMKTVFPFGNEVITIDVTGAQLLEALEAATWSTPTAIGAFPQVSGIKFSVDTSVAYAQGEQYPDSTYYAPKNPGSRVTIHSINGKAFDPKATYTIATNDFTAAGGDTYYVFKAGTNRTMTSVPLEDALINYTREVMNGVISAEKYGKTEGRITIKYVGVVPGAWYVDAARYVMDEGIMTSTGKAGFTPEGVVTRGTVIQTLYNMESKPAVEQAAFADVAGKWYADAANWAAVRGIVQGDNKGNFNGEAVITRQELAIMLTNYMTVKDMTTLKASLSKVTDADSVASWAADAMGYAIGAGIIKGNNGAVNPTGTASRVELAQMLYNFSKLAPAAKDGAAPTAVEGKIISVQKYGNIDLDIMAINLYAAGYRVGDVVTVTVGDHVLDMPLGTNYSDVDTGSLVARDATDSSSPYMIIAINMGDFAKTYGAKVGDTVKLALKTAGGYLAEYEAHQVKRTNNRDDYSSDAVFANFREITLGSIAPGVLYRTSSPINPEIGRAAYADKLIKGAGIATVVNLADSAEEIAKYLAADSFASPYYKGLYEAGSVVTLNMGVDFTAAEFKVKLKEGIEFMLAHEGPYAFHCTEGKDRAGFTAILLEALMGATEAEIVADYMVTYENYYHVERGSDQYTTISRIATGILCEIAGLDKGSDLSKVDLVKAASGYLTGIGLTDTQVSALKTALSTPVAAMKAAA